MRSNGFSFGIKGTKNGIRLGCGLDAHGAYLGGLGLGLGVDGADSGGIRLNWWRFSSILRLATILNCIYHQELFCLLDLDMNLFLLKIIFENSYIFLKIMYLCSYIFHSYILMFAYANCFITFHSWTNSIYITRLCWSQLNIWKFVQYVLVINMVYVSLVQVYFWIYVLVINSCPWFSR